MIEKIETGLSLLDLFLLTSANQRQHVLLLAVKVEREGPIAPSYSTAIDRFDDITFAHATARWHRDARNLVAPTPTGRRS